MTQVLIIIHIVVCVAMIMIVLLQTGKGADKWNQAKRGHTRSRSEHVLFGDTHLEEPIAVCFFEDVGARRVSDVAVDHHDQPDRVGRIVNEGHEPCPAAREPADALFLEGPDLREPLLRGAFSPRPAHSPLSGRP